jgi:hypothetical protein
MANTVTWDQLGTPAAPVAPSQPEPSQAEPSVPFAPEGAGKRTVTFDELGTPPEGYKPPTVMQDLPPAIGSGAARGAMGIAGTPGAIGYYARAGSGALSDVITGSEQRKLDVQRAEEEGLTREQRQAIAEERAIPIGGGLTIPTMRGTDEWGRQNIPGYDYAPSTKVGEAFQSGAQMGTESLIGGPKGVARRVATGFGAGAVSDVAGDVAGEFGGPTAKLFGDVGGAVVADIISHKVLDIGANLGFTNKEAYKKLTDAISADMASNPELRSKLRQASENGEPIYIADLIRGDRATELLLSKYSDKQINALNNINQKLFERREGVQNAVDQKFSGLFQRDLREDTYKKSLADANKLERDKLYTDLKSLPGAQGVMSPELENLANSNGYIATAMDQVNKMSKDGELATSWQVVPPMLGFKPNIQYWDVVKRSLDDVIEKASKGELNNSKNVLGGAQAAKEALVKELDTLIPEYGSVRNQAAEMFGVETSLEAGYELGRKAATGSPFDVGEFVTNFRKLSPDQKESFAEGAARFAMQKAQGNMSSLMTYMENANVRRTMREVMGADRFDDLYAKAVSSNLAATAKDFVLTEKGSAKKIASLIGEVGGGAVGFGAVPALATLNPVGLATLGAATVGALSGIALNASERKVANRVVELSFSTKPEDAKRLSKLLADNYDAVSVSRKLGDYMSSATQKGILAYINNQREAPKPTGSTPGLSIMAPMNTGGRIARKSGGRTGGNSISAEVKRVRALLSEKTASMLSVPDDAIATALHIAKRT